MNRQEELRKIEEYIRDNGVTLCQSDPKLGKNMSSNPRNKKIKRVLMLKDRKNSIPDSLLWGEAKRIPTIEDIFGDDEGYSPPAPIHNGSSFNQKWMQKLAYDAR